ncbi:MAG: hypothetical protein LC740_07450, partial [Actinobacteria bacterium]|nr:hypothetical protein [Actinomycetota bacterium]
MAKPSMLIRWSGPASMLGGVLLIVQFSLSSALGPSQGNPTTSNHYEIYDSLLYVVYNVLFDAALLLFAVGLVGLHARRVSRSGRLGKMGLLLALGAGTLVVVSAFAALAVALWPRSSVLLVLFTQLSAIVFLVIGLVLLSMASAQTTAAKDWISGLGGRGILLILGSGLGAALLSDALEEIINGVYLGLPGNHLLHVLVTIPVAAWVARKVSMAPVLYGVVVGLISGIANQLFNHAIVHPGSMNWTEITIIMVSCVGAGGLGGFIGQATLAEQETLYRASQAIGVVASLQNIVDAIGNHLK